jgi:hypothetical protein
MMRSEPDRATMKKSGFIIYYPQSAIFKRRFGALGRIALPGLKNLFHLEPETDILNLF